MTDFHSHVLPALDDGAKDVKESIELLNMLSSQGVERVFATPHFLPSKESPQSFLERRRAAHEELSASATALPITLELGAEVAYYAGLSRMDSLLDMRLGKSKLLLVEMPIAPWSEYVVGELIGIALSSSITPVIAHVERCIGYQSSKNMKRLLEVGVLMQANASFFVDMKTRRGALKLLRRGELHLLGSDTHGTAYRPPRLAEAYAVINKKLGERAIRELEYISKKVAP